MRPKPFSKHHAAIDHKNIASDISNPCRKSCRPICAQNDAATCRVRDLLNRFIPLRCRDQPRFADMAFNDTPDERPKRCRKGQRIIPRSHKRRKHAVLCPTNRAEASGFVPIFLSFVPFLFLTA